MTIFAFVTPANFKQIERKRIEFDGEFDAINWMLGIIVGGVVMLVLRAFFLSDVRY